MRLNLVSLHDIGIVVVRSKFLKLLLVGINAVFEVLASFCNSFVSVIVRKKLLHLLASVGEFVKSLLLSLLQLFMLLPSVDNTHRGSGHNKPR